MSDIDNFSLFTNWSTQGQISKKLDTMQRHLSSSDADLGDYVRKQNHLWLNFGGGVWLGELAQGSEDWDGMYRRWFWKWCLFCRRRAWDRVAMGHNSDAGSGVEGLKEIWKKHICANKCNFTKLGPYFRFKNAISGCWRWTWDKANDSSLPKTLSKMERIVMNFPIVFAR